MNSTSNSFLELISIINQLRGEKGCPWDQKQTPHSLIKYLKEEVGELVEAIQNDDVPNIYEEIGDVIYVLLMISISSDSNNSNTIYSSLDSINKKLIRRHPHVFEGKEIKSEDELRMQWEEIKKMEKK